MGREWLNVPFEIKSEDVNEDGSFGGYASLFNGTPDDSTKYVDGVLIQGDVVRPGAFKRSLELGGRNGNGVAMLLYHNPDRPVGVWTSIIENQRGLKVEGKLAVKSDDGRNAYELMKIGALKGLSIGFNPYEKGYEIDEQKKIRYLTDIELWEISPVTFPSKRQAQISFVKSAITEAIISEEGSIRDVERALRESGLSRGDATYLASLLRSSLRDLGVKKVGEGETKRVIAYKDFGQASEAMGWDAGGEIKKASTEDLLKMCAWYDSSNPDIKTSYKLPHHRQSDFKAVWRGVFAAMAALLGARGGVNIPDSDKQGVYNHLKKHYDQFEKEPPELRSYDERELKELFPEAVENDFVSLAFLSELRVVNSLIEFERMLRG